MAAAVSLSEPTVVAPVLGAVAICSSCATVAAPVAVIDPTCDRKPLPEVAICAAMLAAVSATPPIVTDPVAPIASIASTPAIVVVPVAMILVGRSAVPKLAAAMLAAVSLML